VVFSAGKTDNVPGTAEGPLWIPYPLMASERAGDGDTAREVVPGALRQAMPSAVGGSDCNVRPASAL